MAKYKVNGLMQLPNYVSLGMICLLARGGLVQMSSNHHLDDQGIPIKSFKESRRFY